MLEKNLEARSKRQAVFSRKKNAKTVANNSITGSPVAPREWPSRLVKPVEVD